MAGENLGSVYYTVDANVGTVLDAKSQVATSTASMVNNFKGVDTQVTKTSKAVTKGMNGMKGAAQNFSYQIQDIAVQLAGGQNPFLVMAQQLPQMLVGMGAAAAGIGALVAILGGLAMAMNTTKKSTKELAEEVSGLSEEYEKLNKSSAMQFLITSEGLIATLVSESAEINKNIKEKEKQIEINKKLLSSYDESSKTYKNMTKSIFDNEQELRGLRAELGIVGDSIDSANSKRAQYTAIVEGDSEAIRKNSKEYKENIKELNNLQLALRAQVDTLGMSSRGMTIYTANMLGATDADRAKINSAYDLIEAEEEKNRVISELSSAKGGLLNPTEEAIVQYQKEQEIFKAALDQKLIAEEEYNALRLRSNQAYVDKLQTVESVAGQSFVDMLAANGASLQSFQASAVGAFASIATGAQDGQTAVRNLAQSILTQMIGALIQMGIQSLIGQTTAAAGAAATGAAIATSMAPAAALVSLASFGANSAPAIAGIAATTAAAEGVALAGARLYGGYTAPNSMYKVNESGKAEMFSDGKNDFLMTGSKGGNVTSANDLAGQQKETVVNVNNYGSSEVDVQTRTEGSGANRREIINIVVADFNSRGSAFSALKRNSNLKDRL